MITKDEFETPRTAADILTWVDAAGERLSATKELKAAARLGRNGAKELWGEARPIALFAYRYFDASPLVTIRHVIGNQNYDATVDDRREHRGPVRFIEVTLSDQTRDDSIRMELLNRDGHAPGTGPVRAEGPRNNRRILEGRSEAVDHIAMREQALGAIHDAIARKLDVQYPAGTALIVRIDDYLPFRTDDDVEVLSAVAEEQFAPLVRGREFCLLALVGSRATNLVYPL